MSDDLTQSLNTHQNSETVAPNWLAVLSLAFTVATLITSELLPVSLLTPMAQDLGISSGLAGQSVAITAIVAMISSLLLPSYSSQMNRRYLLLILSVLLAISNLMVAQATSFVWLLIGRLLLGVSLGGFWAMSSAITMRLVPGEKIAKALSLIFSGVTIATIISAPVGSYFGELIGWRNVFNIAAGLGVITYIIQYYSLPSLPAQQTNSLKNLFKLLLNKRITIGMSAIVLMCGHYAFFTYLRPYIESLPNINITLISVILFVFGIGNLAGTSVSSYVLASKLNQTMATLFTIIAVVMAILLSGVSDFYFVMVLLFVWGVAISIIIVGWSTWLTKTIPEQTEIGGGLLVAAYQIAITIGATMGGFIFETSHINGVLVFAVLASFLASVLSFYSEIKS